MLARIGKKDEEALSALYDRYSGLVFSEARRILRDTGAAEEILQDLFFQVWRTAERFDPARGSLAGWLLVAARNRAISKLRKKSRQTEELNENSVSFSVKVESHAAQNLLLDKVRTVMGTLPESQREALECAYFEGMSHSEIAEKTGQPLGTIKTRIRSAMETLKKVLS
ncbi:MAG: sigma-70 family RNA polymerase sigma factor [Candidatus Acidiferrum sp.]